MAIHNTIVITGDGLYLENLAGSTGLLPGMLVQATSAGARVVHATAGGTGVTEVLHEDTLMGGTVDTLYVNGQLTKSYVPQPGSVIQFRLTDGVAYVKGDKLISAGDGTLKKTTGTPAKTFGEIFEDIDYSVAVSVRLGKVLTY